MHWFKITLLNNHLSSMGPDLLNCIKTVKFFVDRQPTLVATFACLNQNWSLQTQCIVGPAFSVIRLKQFFSKIYLKRIESLPEQYSTLAVFFLSIFFCISYHALCNIYWMQNISLKGYEGVKTAVLLYCQIYFRWFWTCRNLDVSQYQN